MSSNTAVSVFGYEPIRIGNGERFARELGQQLGQHGWQSVIVFASEPRSAVRQFLELPNVTIAVLARPWERSWRAARDLATLLQRHQARLLHLHLTPFIGLYPWIAKLCGVESIFYTEHNSNPEGFVARQASWRKRMISRVLNLPLSYVVCVSDYVQQTMSTLDLIDRGRLCRIYNGVENSPPHNAWQAGLEFRRRFGILPDCPLVIQVSWIIPAKGIDDFLEAAHLVVGRRSDVRFAIVGEGDTRPDYARRAIELGLERHVTWTGLVEDPYNEGVYAAADVICQVSRWQEAFGCTIAEAMMFERPLVATRVGGIPELVCDSVSGFLAAPGDATAIAEHILALVADAELRRTMGECGRTFAVKHFNLRANVAKLLKLYGIAVP